MQRLSVKKYKPWALVSDWILVIRRRNLCVEHIWVSLWTQNIFNPVWKTFKKRFACTFWDGSDHLRPVWLRSVCGQKRGGWLWFIPAGREERSSCLWTSLNCSSFVSLLMVLRFQTGLTGYQIIDFIRTRFLFIVEMYKS